MSDDLLDPEQRRLLAQEIAASRRELEAIVEKIDLASPRDAEEVLRSAVGTLLRELRAVLVQTWHRVNAETSWPASLRGPVRIDTLSPLLHGAVISAMQAVDIAPRFEASEDLLPRLVDRQFADGTALELVLEPRDLPDLPLGRFAVALVPATRYLVLVCGWLLGRLRLGAEWPKTCTVHTKIGPPRAEGWDREDLGAFLGHATAEFHAAVVEEIAARRADAGARA